ncbi:hypothetical protein TNCV_3796561 [Trichonephila clavipes]|nr:hypothetical protein TNCV_3796561 [Trichonephila clavipes]
MVFARFAAVTWENSNVIGSVVVGELMEDPSSNFPHFSKLFEAMNSRGLIDIEASICVVRLLSSSMAARRA